MNRSEIIKFLILRTIGNFLLLFAIFGVFATFGPALYYEAQYQVIKLRGINYSIAEAPKSPRQLTQSGFSKVITGPKEQIITPPDTKFSIIIPKIGASARVFPNIDSANESEFVPILQKGVAHAKGTVFPGMKGNIYFFAHSADNFWDAGRYNAVFYLLKDLAPKDEVVIFFENRRYNYVIEKSVVVEASDVSYLVKSQQVGKEQLLLQTCWPPGTTWKRLIVVAKPKL